MAERPSYAWSPLLKSEHNVSQNICSSQASACRRWWQRTILRRLTPLRALCSLGSLLLAALILNIDTASPSSFALPRKCVQLPHAAPYASPSVYGKVGPLLTSAVSFANIAQLMYAAGVTTGIVQLQRHPCMSLPHDAGQRHTI